MKKIKVGISITLFSILLGIFTYKFIYKISPRDFLGENIALAYVNENISEKKLKDLQKITEGTVVEKNIKEIEKIKKYLKGIYIFTETQLFEKYKEAIGVIDTGFWYPLILKDIGLYFEKTPFFYVLKDEYKEKYTQGKNIYMIPYRGQFIFSLQPELIKKFDGKEYVGSKDLERIMDKEKENRLGIFLYNGKKDKTFNITTAYVTGKLEKEKLKFYLWQENPKENAGYTIQGRKHRNFAEYIKPNFLYFSVSHPEEMEDVILKSLGRNNSNKIFMPFLQGFLGIKFSDIIKEIDGEILFDIKNKNAFFSLKEAKKIGRTFRYFGEDNVIKIGENQLVLEEKYLAYGTEKLQKGNIEKEFTPHNFLYLKLDFEALEKEGLDKGIIEINGYAERRNAHLYADADKEAVKTLINYIEKEVKND